jgi:hypothetical protein
MSIKHRIGISCVLALGFAACGLNDATDDAGITTKPPSPDAAVVTGIDAKLPSPDTAPAVVEPYVWVVIQDTEQKACSTNGPGADIDAVVKMDDKGVVTGLGMIGSAAFTPNPGGNACENVDCSGKNCKYAAIGTTFDQADLVARTEGPANGVVKAVGDDVGYFSLNAGTLQLQIGGALTGAGPAQSIKTGDFIVVYEVDKTYVDASNACVCAPEHFTVSLQTATGKSLALIPSRIETANTTCSLSATEGCGTTVFAVP